MNTGASSSKIRFWSELPPRTLNPLAPSPTDETPGNKRMARKTSASPKSWGSFLTSLALIWATDISVVFKVLTPRSTPTVTSSKPTTEGFNLNTWLVLLVSATCVTCFSYPKLLNVTLAAPAGTVTEK